MLLRETLAHLITDIILLIVLDPLSVRADLADIPWKEPSSITGIFLSADSKGFRFRVGCDGFIIKVPWRKGGRNSHFSRSTNCSGEGGLELTAGVETGGRCDNWRTGSFF